MNSEESKNRKCDFSEKKICPCRDEIKAIPRAITVWDMQYMDEDLLDGIWQRLEEGADPNDMQENETVYEYVLWKLREGESDDYNFQRQLVQLLLAYGGKAPNYGYEWHFNDPNFDVRELADLCNYQTYFRKADNKYCMEGYIIEVDTGKEIAWL